MSLAEFATYINPLIAALKKLGGSARPNEVCSKIAEDLELSDNVLEQRLKNGMSRFENQIHWARFYLARAGYIDSSRRGVWTLSEKGAQSDPLSEEEVRGLVQEVHSKATKSRGASRGGTVEPGSDTESGSFEPDEIKTYREQLLETLKGLPPEGFEQICQRLLREAGFERVEVTQRSGDGGIDGYGVLQVNPFVSFQVLFECKRYEGSVGASKIRDFRGAMQGRAEKGIFLTTGHFSSDARREAIRDGVQSIELVDAEGLVDMFEHLELGLKPKTTYELEAEFFRQFQGKTEL